MDMENDMKTPRPQPNPDPVPGSSANVLDLCCPCSSDIDIGHIAHHLALLNQFGGFTQRPYSFAEHALLATEIAERAFGLTHPATLMGCLLRDAHAAYVGDGRTPVAHVGGEQAACLQYRVQAAIRRRFALKAVSAGFAHVINEAYLAAQATVQRDIAVERLRRLADGTQPAEWMSLHDRSGLTWHDWRQAFFDRFNELQFARNLLTADKSPAGPRKGQRQDVAVPINAPPADRSASGP